LVGTVTERIPLQELDDIRLRQKKTLAQVSRESGLSLATTWRILRGRSYNIKKVGQVCLSLGIDLGHLDIGTPPTTLEQDGNT